MDIKAKENKLFYLLALICEAISDFELQIEKNIVLKNKLIYDAAFQRILSLRNIVEDSLTEKS